LLVVLQSEEPDEAIYERYVNQALSILSVEVSGLAPQKMTMDEAKNILSDILVICRCLELPGYKGAEISRGTQLYLASMLAHAVNTWVYWRAKKGLPADQASVQIMQETMKFIRMNLQRASFSVGLNQDDTKGIEKGVAHFTYLSSTMQYMLNSDSVHGQVHQSVEVFQIIALLFDTGTYERVSERAQKSLADILKKTAQILRDNPQEMQGIGLDDFKWLFQSLKRFVQNEKVILVVDQNDLATFVDCLSQLAPHMHHRQHLSFKFMLDALRDILKYYCENQINDTLKKVLYQLFHASRNIFDSSHRTQGDNAIKESILFFISSIAIENHIDLSFGLEFNIEIFLKHYKIDTYAAEDDRQEHAMHRRKISDKIVLLHKLQKLEVIDYSDMTKYLEADLNTGMIIKEVSLNGEQLHELNLHDFSIEASQSAFLYWWTVILPEKVSKGHLPDFCVVVGKGSGTQESKFISYRDPILDRVQPVSPLKHAIFELIAGLKQSHEFEITYNLGHYGQKLNDGVIFVARSAEGMKMAQTRNVMIQGWMNGESNASTHAMTASPVLHGLRKDLDGSMTGSNDSTVLVVSDRMKLD
jgi:hypothetical protein